MRGDVFGRARAVDEPFEKAVRGQTIRAVKAGTRHLARRPEARQGGPGVVVNGHAADHVVRAGTNRDRVAGDVEIEAAAEAVDPGEPLADVSRVEVGEVEIDARVAGLGHLLGDRARDVVARGEFGERVVLGHEPVAVAVAEMRPFAAEGFGEQVRAEPAM